MKSWLTLGNRIGLGALALAASVVAFSTSSPATGASFLPPPDGAGGSGDDETTVTISTSADAKASTFKLPELNVGESRDITTDSGKTVTVTRTESGYTVHIGGKDVLVGLPGDGDHFAFVEGLPGHGEDVRTVVSGDGGTRKVMVFKTGGYGFQTGEPTAASVQELLDKSRPDALTGVDSRTRETVTKTLEELVQKGIVIAPGLDMKGLPGGDGEGVRVKVIRKKSSGSAN